MSIIRYGPFQGYLMRNQRFGLAWALEDGYYHFPRTASVL